MEDSRDQLRIQLERLIQEMQSLGDALKLHVEDVNRRKELTDADRLFEKTWREEMDKAILAFENIKKQIGKLEGFTLD